MKFGIKEVFDIKRDEVLGLDIGSYAVKIVQLRKEQSGYSVVAAAKVDIEPGKNSESDDEDIRVVRAVQECLRLSAAKSQIAVCSICGPEVAIRRFKFPLLPRDEINNAIMLEAAQVCPFNFSESVIDYQIVPNGKDSIRGILVAATDRVVQKKKWFAQEALLKPVLMDVDGLALLNCLENCSTKTNGANIAILNVGSSFTTLAVVDNDKSPFIRDIGFAGRDIVSNLASQFDSEPAAIYRNLFSPKNPVDDKINIKNALPYACQKLVEDVSETLRYYAANEKAQVDQIYICGGFAVVDGFVELLKRSFAANVQLWNPFESFSNRIPAYLSDFLKRQGASMAVAAGLAMRTV